MGRFWGGIFGRECGDLFTFVKRKATKTQGAFDSGGNRVSRGDRGGRAKDFSPSHLLRKLTSSQGT